MTEVIELFSFVRDTTDLISRENVKNLKVTNQTITHNPYIGLVITLVAALLDGVSLFGVWHVWVQFQQDGFSDNPLIPPVVAWMSGWLALAIVQTLVAFAELATGLVLFGVEVHTRRTNGGEVLRFCLKFVEEFLSSMGMWLDLFLLLLGYFYFVVQSDCMDLNRIDSVIVSMTLLTAHLIWDIMRFAIVVIIKSGICGTRNMNLKDLYPKLMVKAICGWYIIVPIMSISGIVLLGLVGTLADSVNAFNTSSIHVMRSNPNTTYFPVTELSSNLTFTEEFDNISDKIYCLATFRYDPDAYDFVYNVAYIDINASLENNLCICVTNHDDCEPHYDKLYYGYSSNGAPYECFRRSHIVGVDRENSPTRDRDSEVHCTCDLVSLVPASTIITSGSGASASGIFPETDMSSSGSGSELEIIDYEADSSGNSESGSWLTPLHYES